MTRRLSRTVSAIHDRGEAPTTATLRGANSGRRSIAAGLAVGRRPSSDHPADAPLLERPGDDQPLDLRGAFPDPVDPQLAQEPLGANSRM